MNITDDQVRVALDGYYQGVTVPAGFKPGLAEHQNMRAALTAFLASLGGEQVAWQCRERFWDGAPWGHWRTFNHRSERDNHAAMLREDNWLTESRDLYTSAIAAYMAGGEPIAWLIQRNGNTVACMAREPGNVVARDEVVVPVYASALAARMAGGGEPVAYASEDTVEVLRVTGTARIIEKPMGRFTIPWYSHPATARAGVDRWTFSRIDAETVTASRPGDVGCVAREGASHRDGGIPEYVLYALVSDIIDQQGGDRG